MAVSLSPVSVLDACLSVLSVASDFFPWSGHHPEDVLNELSTKNGFYDKLGSSQNESLPARALILSSLRQKSASKILSSLFVSVLDRRQEHGSVSTNSTFKPPPRVTLTDTKREAWLRDLANPSIPLRRLSRTIPHGIRGKILLDHCLNKEIPTSRALWLVKCVGANEIRAFKRKGAGGVFTMGGESKWVQEWTASVQQFLDGVLADCANAQWKQKVSYSLRLVSQIYTEDLLDRKHYLDWLLQRLESSDLDRLPIWLLPFYIHKEEIACSRQHGKRMAFALLSHLETASKLVPKVFEPLQQELAEAIGILMRSSMESFLSPADWERYESLVPKLVIRNDVTKSLLHESIVHRNRVLRGPFQHSKRPVPTSIGERVIKALDGSKHEESLPKIAKTCLDICQSHKSLVLICMRWATSRCRYGRHRAFIAANILKTWNEEGIDIQDQIHEFLVMSPDREYTDMAEVYTIVAELVTSGHFSVGRYCQWLLARGTFSKARSNSTHIEACLLKELPVSGLPTHARNLRGSLLRSAGTSVRSEEAMIERLKLQVSSQLPSILPHPHDITANELAVETQDLASCSVTIRYAIAKWILDGIQGSVGRGKQIAAARQAADVQLARITLDQFTSLRDILEKLGVYSIFALFLKRLCRSRHIPVLGAVAETINYHFDVFHALGSVKLLFDMLYSQAHLLPSFKESDRYFAQTLIDLGSRIPTRRQELSNLEKEARSFEARQSAAAPSPLSDTMIDAVHSSNGTFVDEMDQLLANCTNMDGATLVRAFQTITRHLLQALDGEQSPQPRIYELLARLRTFNNSGFDDLMTNWLDSIIRSKSRPTLSAFLTPAICRNAVTLKAALSSIMKGIEDNSLEPSLALDALDLLSGMQEECVPASSSHSYRFLDQQLREVQGSIELVCIVIATNIENAKGPKDSLFEKTGLLLESASCKSLIRMVLSQVAMDNEFASRAIPAVQASVKTILRWKSSQSPVVDARQQVVELVGAVDDLNLTLCQLEVVDLLESSSEMNEAVPGILADVLVTKLSSMPDTKTEPWAKFLSALPTSCTAAIWERAEEMLLAWMDSQLPSHNLNSNMNTEGLLDLIQLSMTTIRPDDTSNSIKQISAKLLDIAALSPRPESSELPQHKVIEVILRLLIIHQSTIQRPQFNQDELSQICLTLAQMYKFYVQYTSGSFCDKILDVLILLSDSLVDASRSRCLSVLSTSKQVKDARLYYVFNTSGHQECHWLRVLRPQDSTNHSNGDGTVQREETTEPYHLRKWEMVQDVTPSMAENDTSISLALFGARKSVF